MRKNGLLIFFIILGLQVNYSQEPIELEGQVMADSLGKEFLNVYNVTRSRGTITDDQGRFRIKANLHDTISISSLQYDELRFIVNSILYERKKVSFSLTPKVNNLGEIKINNLELYGDLTLDANGTRFANLTLDQLGFGDVKRSNLTAEERKYNAAVGGRKYNTNIHAVTLVGISVDRIVNAFSGKNKKLKQIAEISRFEKNIMSLRQSFPDSIYVQDFKVGKPLIQDFVFWMIEEGDEIEALKQQNKLQLFGHFQRRAMTYIALRKKLIEIATKDN